MGANIGYYTILLADKVGNNGKIYAFEPDKTSFEILNKNIRENKLKNVVAVNAAVGSKNGKIKLYKSEKNFGDHKLYRKDKKVNEVKVIKLDDYLKDIKIDLIKIDTQGWKPEVIKGVQNLISKNKPTVFLEYSPASYTQAKLNGKEMMKNLGKIYKKVWWIDEWLYIYKNLSQKKIDKICTTNKTGYADLWMKKEIGLNDKIGKIRDLKIKELIKKFCKI